MPGQGDITGMKRSTPITWLWDGYMPSLGITVIQGDIGTGKSTVANSIAARVTNGLPMPGATNALLPPSAVGYLQKEASDATALWRLIAAGADEDKLVPLIADEDGHWEFPRDFKLLAHLVKDNDIKVLILDPWYDFVSPHYMSRPNTVRKIATQFNEFAHKHGIAIIALSHLNKNTKQAASQRSTGAQGLTQISRALIQVGVDPSNTDVHVFAPVRISDADTPPSLTFHTVGVDVTPPLRPRQKEANKYSMVVAEWLGTTSLQSDDISTSKRNSERTSGEPGSFVPRNLVKEHLTQALANGPRLVSDVFDECVELYQTTSATFKRARKDMGIVSVSRPGTKKKYMALPDKTQGAAVRKPTRLTRVKPTGTARRLTRAEVDDVLREHRAMKAKRDNKTTPPTPSKPLPRVKKTPPPHTLVKKAVDFPTAKPEAKKVGLRKNPKQLTIDNELDQLREKLRRFQNAHETRRDRTRFDDTREEQNALDNVVSFKARRRSARKFG